MPIVRKAATAAAIALLCGGRAEGQGSGLSTAEIARRAKPATVVIATIDAAGDTSGFGSGVIVRADGVVLTNWHVVRGASAAVVQLASGELYDRVDIIDLDSIADIAVLKIPGYQLPVVVVGAGLPTVGERVVAIGAPRGYTETVSEGIVSAVRVVAGRRLVQMTTPISPGSSGGPVLNARGQLVALAKAIRTDGQALNFAVPVQYGMGLLTNNAVARPMAEVTAVASTQRGSPASSDSGVSSAELRSFLDDPAEGAERAATPREYLAGSYRALLAWERTGQDPTYAMGWLFVASQRRGILVLTDSDQRSFLMPIEQARMTRDGRLALTFADDSLIPPLSGTELANGRLVASGSSQKSSKRAGIALQEKAPPVTEVTGLYEIRLLGKRENNGKKVEWTGRAAVAVDGAGLAAIDMILVGAEDVGYGAFLSGTIDADGMIALKVKGTRISFTGVLRDGAISGNVVLEWDDVTVTGRITGARE